MLEHCDREEAVAKQALTRAQPEGPFPRACLKLALHYGHVHFTQHIWLWLLSLSAFVEYHLVGRAQVEKGKNR